MITDCGISSALTMLVHKLSVLRLGRERLVGDYLDSFNPDIIGPSWEYIDSPSSMFIAWERYRLIWLLSHGKIAEDYIASLDVSADTKDDLRRELSSILLELLHFWYHHVVKDPRLSQFYISIIKDYLDSHNSMLTTATNAHKHLSVLDTMLKRSRVIMRREMERLRSPPQPSSTQ